MSGENSLGSDQMGLLKANWIKYLYLLIGSLNGLEVHNLSWIETFRIIVLFCSVLKMLIGSPNHSGSLTAGLKISHLGI